MKDFESLRTVLHTENSQNLLRIITKKCIKKDRQENRGNSWGWCVFYGKLFGYTKYMRKDTWIDTEGRNEVYNFWIGGYVTMNLWTGDP